MAIDDTNVRPNLQAILLDLLAAGFLSRRSAAEILDRAKRPEFRAFMRVEDKDGQVLGEARLGYDDCEIVRQASPIDHFDLVSPKPIHQVLSAETIFRIGSRSWLTTRMWVADEGAAVTYVARASQPYNEDTDVVHRTMTGDVVVIRRSF